MKFVTLNERAAATAMDFIVGNETRVKIEQLYDVLNQAEQAGYDAGEAIGHNKGYNEGFPDGHSVGYDQGLTVSTADVQPEVLHDFDGSTTIYLPPYNEVTGYDSLYASDDTLPPMQEQRSALHKSNPFAWS